MKSRLRKASKPLWEEQTLDGQPGGVLRLAVRAARSADINSFVALLKVLDPAGEHHGHDVKQTKPDIQSRFNSNIFSIQRSEKNSIPVLQS